MKFFIITFLFLSAFFEVSAQYPRIIVQLKDKGSSTFSIADPSRYLSARAIQRRSRFGIAVDSLDIPVSAVYIESIRLAGNVSKINTSRWLNSVLIETTDQNAISKIQALPFVRTIRGIGYRSMTVPSDDKFKETVSTRATTPVNRAAEAADNHFDYGNTYAQVHIHQGEFLHNKGFRGETMQVAVLDAGFQQYKSLGAFDSIRLGGQVLGERDFVAFDNSVDEDDSHGMHCLSILSANWPGKMVGTAPKANYWLLRTENPASEYPVEEYNWVVGAEFADSAGSDLISSSLGYSTFDAPSFNHSYSDLYKNNTMISQGAAIAARKGMIVPVSAGNEGSNGWKYITFPADADSVCTVGAVNGAGTVAGFSSHGYQGKLKPNIVSLGAGTVIAGLNNVPIAGNGTSYSNPNLAGLLACLWQAFPRANNMKILEAVYKSADRYHAPDNRYGYGIPDFKAAYRILKHDENVAEFGDDWLFATPNPFNSEIEVRLIGQIDGTTTLSIVNAGGQVVATRNILSEKEEAIKVVFPNLTSLPAGLYSVKYTDSVTSRTLPLQKGNIFEKDWLVAVPNPFNNTLSVFINPGETGEVKVRLIDTKGGVVETVTEMVNQNVSKTVHFNNVRNLSAGVYFLQYIGKTQKRTLRLFKG